jgi:membrane protein YdbS with pleckstrin-like domain
MTTASLITNQGIAALKAGDKVEARKWLELAVKRNPNDFTAWLWLSGSMEKEQDRLDCLQQVLRVVPNNAAAAAGIARINAGKEATAVPPEEEFPKVAPFVDVDEVQKKLTNPATRRQASLGVEKPTENKIYERVIFSIRPSFLPFMLKSSFAVLELGAVAWLIFRFAADSVLLMVVLAVISGLTLMILLVVIIRALLYCLFESYELTTQALIIQKGVINTQSITIPAAHIRKVMRPKNRLSKIFRIGDIEIILSLASPHQENILLRSVLSCPQRVRQIMSITKFR